MLKYKNQLLAVLLSALLVSLSGCSDQERVIERIETVCDKGSKKDRAEFTLQCIANGNPKSDEEPEDWIYMCERMAKKNYCDDVTVEVTQWKNGAMGSIWKDTRIKQKAN